MFKNIKIEVKSPIESVELQKLLFENGCFWDNPQRPRTEISFTDYSYLYVDNISKLTYGSTKSYFDMAKHKEMEFSLVPRLTEVVRRETIELNGLVYYKDELEIAIANIKPVV